VIIGPDKTHKAFDKALETYTPYQDWRYLGESFRYAMWDERKLANLREFLVGFSIADSKAMRGQVDDSWGDEV